MNVFALFKKNLAIKISLLLVIIFLSFVLFFKHHTSYEIVEHLDTSFGEAWIFEQNGQRCMSFKKPPLTILQSCIFIKNPKIVLHEYIKIFLSTLFLKDNPQKILVIGLGGGNVQSALNTLIPEAQIHTVEINPELPRLAQQYFGYGEDTHNHIFISDGVIFAQKAEANTYDLILIDVFSQNYIPPQFLTTQFLVNLKKTLAPTGIVAMNTFVDSKSFELESDLFRSTFGEYYNLVSSNSRVMIASNGVLPTTTKIQDTAKIWESSFAELGINHSRLLNLYNTHDN